MKVQRTGAIVAGGASGLGAATVRALHEAGALVVIADLNAELGEELASELGDRASFAQADVADPDSVKAAIDAAAQADGGLRISVCCAGIGWVGRVAGKDGPTTWRCIRR
jgi:3-hydroxyacyl-CoA dehydrogenase / 3-hydroxy-2-methylbutyryl-CoA dehydrogenase